MTTRLGAVLCDLGGVIVPAPFDAFAALEQRSGVASGAIREINMRNPDGNAWARIARGEITVDEFVDLFTDEAHAAGHRLPARDVIDLVYRLSPSVEVSDPAMIQALSLCRERGLALALITNNMCAIGDNREAKWLFDLFDTVIESCIVGVRKPEPAIYRLGPLGNLRGSSAPDRVRAGSVAMFRSGSSLRGGLLPWLWRLAFAAKLDRRSVASSDRLRGRPDRCRLVRRERCGVERQRSVRRCAADGRGRHASCACR